MRPSPFLDDPRDLMKDHIAQAVASPIEAVRAIHIRAAEHQAALARASGLAIRDRRDGRVMPPPAPAVATGRLRALLGRLVARIGRMLGRGRPSDMMQGE